VQWRLSVRSSTRGLTCAVGWAWRAQAPFAVNGSVEVELEIERPTRCVVLHAASMNITHAALLQPEHTHGAARGPRRPG